ncbi:MAG: M36 family metallopeptidase [Flavobacteriales bacterium]|nr:M36 family metallopeptidase [Flavobacteriales bacterium]
MTFRNWNAALAVLLLSATLVHGQGAGADAVSLAKERLLEQGFHADDLQHFVIKDDYTTAHNGVRHVFLRQLWQGMEVWNGDVALHLAPGGDVLAFHAGAFKHLGKRANAPSPSINAVDALGRVLPTTLPGVAMPQLVSVEDGGKRHIYQGDGFGGEPVVVQLVWQPMGDSARLAWNVNHYTPDGSHWWNIRIDAHTSEELDRNDWVSQCDFHPHHDMACPHDHFLADPLPEEEMALGMMGPNDYRVYAWPIESPSHGARTMENAPWLQGGIASPFGWHDTSGVAGPEYFDTRGNNVWAQEDMDANNTGGFRPNGGATLEFDFPINFAQQPNNYQSAAITNLFYWNNVLHDMSYQYGFDEPSGNFQANNYGRGGMQNDRVNADALDGSGTNNANFATPPDGARPRMQMFVWTITNPNRTSDLDNGVIAHEYAHGISNRLVGGPSNTGCLGNAEQMGEGWSDYFSLMTTLKAGDLGTTGRGIGTYLLGQPTTGVGIRPARYSTNFGVNGYTYGATNNTAAISMPHGIGFVWCTILWEVTWELIGIYGLDPDLYNGTGGNNIAMQLVMDGMKLTPCNPGFVDARDAILLADQINNGGVNQGALWAAFARRGLGVSASQGLTSSRTDQVEAFDVPMANNVGIQTILAPLAGNMPLCGSTPVTVRARIRNYGMQPQGNFPVSYRLNAGAWVTETFTGTLASGASFDFNFSTGLLLPLGAHTVTVRTELAGDGYAADNQQSVAVTVVAGVTLDVPFTEGLAVPGTTPPGWSLVNPDNSFTWISGNLAAGVGPNCNAGERVWAVDHYNYPAMGELDFLITPRIDLTTHFGARLVFDHAYARYDNNYFDGLRIDVSTDCGAAWTTVFQQIGAPLATAPNTTAQFSPACNQWRNNIVDLAAFDGQMIMIRFVSINGFGNWFYMDNVSVQSQGTILPVEFLSIAAKSVDQGIAVEWSTATETNSDHYVVERSADLEKWEMIGTVDAAGYSLTTIAYHFLDRAPSQGVNYYRLDQVDQDGSSEHSPVVNAWWSAMRPQLFPNPNTGVFTISRLASDMPIEVIDALGRSVPFSLEAVADGLVHVRLLEPRSGLYLVRMGDGQERVVVTGDR